MRSVLKFMVKKFTKLTWDNGNTVDDVWFLNDLQNGRQKHKMDHLVCFISDALVLSAEHAETKELSDSYMKLAERVTALCRNFYVSQATGISPDVVQSDGFKRIFSTANQSNQRPEVVEAIFYMYRKTGDEKYRKWNWENFQAMKSAYRTDTGWTGLRDVRRKYFSPENREDVTNSFFLAETLKYLYLTFGSSDEIDLNEWVFNTEAHPIKVSDKFTHPF